MVVLTFASQWGQDKCKLFLIASSDVETLTEF